MKKEKISTKEIQRFCPSPSTGLSDSFVAQRISEKLVNTVKTNYSKSYLNIFINNFCTFFNLLGLIVAVALIIIKAPFSSFFFVFIYLANIFIGVTQEIRAKKCIEKLCLITSKSTNVIRNGKLLSISPAEIVLDDILSLGLGNQIPTDSLIIEGEIEVNESLLTGESIPVKKKKGDLIFAGSFITCGSCIAKAEKVGIDNYASTLSEKAKKYKKPNSELMNSLKIIIKIIGLIIVPIAIAHILRSILLLSSDIFEAISGTSTLVIGMIPSGMFLLTSLALATGILKLSAHNTLIQDLYSLEMLARVDTICFDKTGTITDGNMSVKSIIPLQDYKEQQIKDIFKKLLGALDNNNQTSNALVSYFGTEKADIKDKLQFNSNRKYSAVSINNDKSYFFGAPEFILKKEKFLKISNEIEEYTKYGFRVIVLATSNEDINSDLMPNYATPIALICLMDNIRNDAYQTVKWFKDNDVEIKVISGDNPLTVSEIAKRVGIDNAEKYISLDGLTDEEVKKIATEYTIFGRVNPEQKALLISALKTAGRTVAMTGDGVNDILAMKEADCAVTVASGSEATRNVSHIVLMDNNFSSMPKVVLEGRRVINNVEGSSSLYLMKTIFTMIFSILTLCLPYLDAYPFKLSQMILLEVFVIGMPSFFLSLQPNNSRVKGKFLKQVFSKTLPSAVLMILSVLIVEICKLTIHQFPDSVYTTMEVYALSLAGLISLIALCIPFNKYRGTLIVISFMFVFGIIIYSIINGFTLLELVPLTPLSKYWTHILINVGIVIIDIPLIILLKKLFSKINPKNIKIKLKNKK